MTGLGVAALPEGARIDFGALRTARRDRLFRAMEAADLDVVVLGRPGNIAFVTGARSLWTAGSRPFSPACIVFAEDRRIHLLATWDEGVPEDIPREQLFGLTWNPDIAAEHVSAVPGLSDARRIGADGTSISFRRLMAVAAPAAEVVDARSAVHGARSTKSVEEVTAIETACALSEAGLEAMRAALEPGTTSRRLLGAHARRMGDLGAPVIPSESVAFATADGFATVVDDRPIAAGALVSLSPSASYAGYEGTIARTTVVDAEPTAAQVDLGGRCRTALDAVIAACQPEVPGAALLDAWTSAGGADFQAPLAHGLGLGIEAPVIGMGLGRTTPLHAGTVVAVQGWFHDTAVGGWLERDVVAVTTDGPQLLTRWNSG